MNVQEEQTIVSKPATILVEGITALADLDILEAQVVLVWMASQLSKF